MAAGSVYRSSCPCNSRKLMASGFLTALAFAVSGCAGGDAPPPAEEAGPETVYGTPLSLGGGSIRTYMVNEGDRLLELGIAIGEAALTDLPPNNGPGSMPMPDGNSTYEYVLDLPPGHGTLFQFATLDWNPGGHDPAGVYDTPHFDAHFYLMTEEERMGIDPMNPEFAAMSAAIPEPDLMPPGHIQPMPEPAAVPMMGVHWLDPTSPELAGTGPFTSTYIYGTWDGDLIFMEPMFTLELLQSQPSLRQSVPVPTRYAAPGLYPHEYQIRWDEASREYRVAISDIRMME